MEHDAEIIGSLLTIEESGQADALAVASGVTAHDLMAAAGAAVFAAIQRLADERGSDRPNVMPPNVTVICGPGNNGGDGFVVARLLLAEGWPVRLGFLGNLERLSDEARANAEAWRDEIGGDIDSLEDLLGTDAVQTTDIFVDALFGAGLSRALSGLAEDAVALIDRQRRNSGAAVIAIDIPSGIDGNSGQVAGRAVTADVTVTFFRAKPGHMLLPGRFHCGRLFVADIGIAETALGEIAPAISVNSPDLWQGLYPWPRVGDHKYTRGLAVIAGGGELTGAAQLAAQGAMRAGAGMTAIAAPVQAAPIYRAGAPGLVVHEVAGLADFDKIVADRRVSGCLIGPGAGVGEETRARTLVMLRRGAPVVIDADGLTSFADDPGGLFAAIRAAGTCVLTPHEGEFNRLFGSSISDQSLPKWQRVRDATDKSGAVVLLKGADTVIGAPDGRLAINVNAPPELATAGSGDVLAGFIVALLAQGMAGYEAACAAVWLHGASAESFGPGLIAEDIPEQLPAILRKLKGRGVLER